MIRLTALTICVAVVSLGCRAESQALQKSDDTTIAVASADTVLDSLRELLAHRFAPTNEVLASLPRMLGPVSGSARADSVLVQQGTALNRKIDTAVSTFYESEFQALIWPDGADGQHKRRIQGRTAQPPTARELLVADSIRLLLLSHGIWSYRGEGNTYFTLSIEHFDSIVSPFVTDASREALRIEILEQLTPIGGDAAVSIPWDSLGDRLASTDRFLVSFPAAAARSDIARLQRRYLQAFLTGWDNTSVFDHDKRLRPEVRASFQRYLQMHGATRSAHVVRAFMELMAKAGYRRSAEIDDFLRTQRPS